MNCPILMPHYRPTPVAPAAMRASPRAGLALDGLQNSCHSSRLASSLSPQFTSEPWWLIKATAGKTVGKGQLGSLGFATHIEGRADVKGDFHEAEITVKQISKCPIYWAFYEISMKANGLKTMATASNYRPCGEGCGENRGTQKEVSNG